MECHLKFQKFALKYPQDLWIDLNIDDESQEPIFKNSCWLMPTKETDDYLKRGTCILVKEFTPDVDVIEREKHRDKITEDVQNKMDINIYEEGNEDYLGFDRYLTDYVHSYYHKVATDAGHIQYRAKYIIAKESFSLLIVIKIFDKSSAEVISNIHDVLKSIR